MKIRKDLVAAILCTFCITAVLFMVVSVKSTGTYDAWLDTNSDGKVNVLDLIKVAGVLGTSGDPSKNVNVTNWPSNLGGPDKMTLFGVRTHMIQSLQSSTDISEFVTDMEPYADYSTASSLLTAYKILPPNMTSRLTVMNETVMMDQPFQSNVKVEGTAKIRLDMSYNGGWFAAVLYAEKISPDNSVKIIWSYNFTQTSGANGGYFINGYLEVPINTTFSPGDRFAIRLLDQGWNNDPVYYGNTGMTWYFSYYTALNTNEEPAQRQYCDFYIELPISPVH